MVLALYPRLMVMPQQIIQEVGGIVMVAVTRGAGGFTRDAPKGGSSYSQRPLLHSARVLEVLAWTAVGTL